MMPRNDFSQDTEIELLNHFDRALPAGFQADGKTCSPSGQRERTRGRRQLCGFDFTEAMRDVVTDMTMRLPELSHINPTLVAISFSQARTASQYGTFATLTPLRFADGARIKMRSGQKWTMQQVRDHHGREMLYILTFYMPRFQNMSLDEKLTTIIHELYHISPKFNGDIRRFGGRCYAHSGSQKRYDALMAQLTRKWLMLGPPTTIYDFLHHDFPGLTQRYGQVIGTRITAPKVYCIQ